MYFCLDGSCCFRQTEKILPFIGIFMKADFEKFMLMPSLIFCFHQIFFAENADFHQIFFTENADFHQIFVLRIVLVR